MSEQSQEGVQEEKQGEHNRILREVLQQERLQSDQDLATALARYSQAYYAPQEGTSDVTNLETIFDEARRIRIYVISQAVDWLYGKSVPQSLIEIGSAGGITAAMALPQTQITSLDEDPQIFLNVPNNSLPREVYTRLGMKKTMEGYGRDNIWRSKKRKLAVVEKCLPNWRKLIADAGNLPFADNSYDVALVQGPLEAEDFLGEMTRIVKPGGHIVTILHEDYKAVDSPSVYDTHRYNQYPDIPVLNPQHCQSIGLQAIEIPDRLRRYENLATWKEKNGTLKATGIVFHAFRKN